MKDNIVRIALTVLAVVVASALEELLPHPGGVGFPLLMGFSMFVSEKWSVIAMVFVAVTAGGCEDSLSALPYFSSMMYFLLCGAVIRWSHSRMTCAVAAYPVYQLWLSLWGHGGFAEALPRFVWALPVGAVTVLLTLGLCATVTERAGVE